MSATPTTWSNPMRKLLDVCRRLEDHWAGDIIGVAFLFALIPSVLFFGPIIFGGR